MQRLASLTALALFANSMLSVLFPNAAFADDAFPTKPIHLVVPFGAGGSVDLVARVLANVLSQKWQQQVLVENRVGADGDLGAEIVARAPPDGYTLMMTSQAVATNVSLHASQPFDPKKDFSPIMVVASTASVLFASPSLNASSLADVIRAAKANPGHLNYGSAGIGTSGNLAVELFKYQEGLDILHIPYNDYGQQTVALLRGDISLVSVTVPQALGLIGTGKLKPLAVSGATRTSALPDVPTMREAGVKDYEALTWYGLYAPGGMPANLVGEINGAFRSALDSPEVKSKLSSLGVDIVGSSPDYHRDYLAQETIKWAKVIKAAGIAP